MDIQVKNGITYELSAGKKWYIVTGVDTNSVTPANLAANLKILCIAAEINQKPVKSIRLEAFKNNPYIEAVYIPKTVTHCGHQAFAKCENLKEVVWYGDISKTVEMGHLVFLDCPKLVSVTINSKLKAGTKCFCKCSSLTTFACGYVDTIPTDFFVGCRSLEQLSFVECGALNRGSFIGSGVKKIGFHSDAPKLFDGTIEQWQHDGIEVECFSDNPLVELSYEGVKINAISF